LLLDAVLFGAVPSNCTLDNALPVLMFHVFAVNRENGEDSMLPGFRFLFATIVLSVSVLVFGLGAAALLRAAHDNFANLPSAKTLQEAAVAHDRETRRATLALMRVEMIAEQQEHVQKMAATSTAVAVEADRPSQKNSDVASSTDTSPVVSPLPVASDVKTAGDAPAAIASVQMASNPSGSDLSPNAEGGSAIVATAEPATVAVPATPEASSKSDAASASVAAHPADAATPDPTKSESAITQATLDKATSDTAASGTTQPAAVASDAVPSGTNASGIKADIKADAGSGPAPIEPRPDTSTNISADTSSQPSSSQPSRSQVAALVDPVAVRAPPPAPLGNAVANSVKASKIELMSDLKLIMQSFPASRTRPKKSASIRAAREARLAAIARRRRFAMRARAAASAQQQQIYQQQQLRQNPFGVGANAATASPTQVR
jgi:hypothetical protein